MQGLLKRKLVLVMVVCAAWMGLSLPAWADVRVVTDTEGERSELFLKGNQFLGGLPSDAGVRVRVTKVGEESVAGFPADHYRVETAKGGDWRVYEELWVSSDLLQLARAEVGDCVDVMLDFMQSLATLGSVFSVFGMDVATAVAESSDYQALTRRGFPVRSRVSTSVFGMPIETTSEIVEVSQDSISEEVFAVPAGYTPVSSPLELFEM